MTERIDRETFLERALGLARDTAPGSRCILAITGAPASGKSTLADAAVDLVNAAHPGRAALVPMDGFHLDDEILVPLGWRPRKGAPHTFDVGGLRSALVRIRAGEKPWVAVPRFDREIEIARAGATLIEPAARLIVVEGNYLLFDDPPWPTLAPLFDVTAMAEVPEDELSRRLRARWVQYGLDEAAIRQKLDDNDLPNARAIRDRSRPADWTIAV